MTGINELKESPLFKWTGSHNSSSLAFYRICFGFLMFFSITRFASYGWINELYIVPEFHFSYYGFEWLPYPSSFWIYTLFVLAFIGALGIMLGLFYRFSAIIFFLCFTYIELLDKTYYLNHYYFVSLIALILIFLPANSAYSLDKRFGFIKGSSTVPRWTISILIFQITVVYFYAGLAKINYDWVIEAQPLRIWLNGASDWPLVGNLFTQDWVAYFFSWFGLVYDLFIVFFLIVSRTRPIAFSLVFSFHFLTWLLFPIGVFPWVMMVGSLIFLNPETHQKILERILGRSKDNSRQGVSKLKNIPKVLISAFIIIQLTFPFRFLLYESDLFWKESAYRFGWRVMLMEKAGYANFYIEENDASFEIPNTRHLTTFQEKQMSMQPDMILQYAHYLGEIYSDTTMEIHGHKFNFAAPEVHAEVYVTLNGRTSQLFVDRSVNLMEVPYDLSERDWVEDYKE